MKISSYAFGLCILATIAVAFPSCKQTGGGVGPEVPPAQYAITVDTAADSLYRGQKVVIEGYLRLPFSMFVFDRTPLELYPRPNQREGRFLNVALNRVDSSSGGVVKLPSSYTAADLRVVTETGDTLRGTDRVRLCGRIVWSEPGEGASGPVVTLEVDSVFKGREEVLPYPSLKTVRLDSAMLSDHGRLNYLVTAEGLLQVPSMMFAFKEYWLYLDGSFGRVSVNFITGDCAGCLDSVPSNYKDSDFKVRASDGEAIDMTRRVRVIGNYTGPDSLTTGDVSVEFIEQIIE